MLAFKIFDVVNTIYGTGFIVAIRDDCFVVELTNWKLAQGQSPTLYLQADALTYVVDLWIAQFVC
jgi:hypothetical protein